ncbi:bifunctional riboflavin kinase/FAD synthetase [Clostridium chrysemydis]|uniref:bifunctional riboflavin kinase/FAD synthetase n=1 Tax=Clostridium chrysemydis TaxID=2665504 RepID=UPI001883696A|nr:bifunctional riboflavin kinase/FAD synthetase [Clostridium chrysemydis]
MMDKKDKFIRNEKSGYYIALGSFDGLHKGHLELVKKIVSLAKNNNSYSMVYTFKNHPRKIISSNSDIELLMNNSTKVRLLEEFGVDEIVLKEFTKDLMKEPPEDFIKKLCANYKVKGIVVGFNYRFGYKNKGDLELLKSLSKVYGYKLYVIDPLMVENDVVSSTRIRNYLKNGHVEKAMRLLQRPYSLEGVVVGGKKLGRTIGFPTANLKVSEDMLIPKKGVYYTNVIYNNEKFKGITSVGTNPTVNGEKITIETYILNFDRIIYDKELKLIFLERIRDEKKFNSIEELVERLKKDKDFAKKRELYNKK